MAADVMPAELEAARFADTLWAAIRTAGDPRAREHRHFPGAFGAAIITIGSQHVLLTAETQ